MLIILRSQCIWSCARSLEEARIGQFLGNSETHWLFWYIYENKIFEHLNFILIISILSPVKEKFSVHQNGVEWVERIHKIWNWNIFSFNVYPHMHFIVFRWPDYSKSDTFLHMAFCQILAALDHFQWSVKEKIHAAIEAAQRFIKSTVISR